MKSRKITLLTLGLTFFLLSSVTHAFNLFSRYEKVIPENGLVRFSIAAISDGKPHYYSYKDGDGTTIKFFLLKSRDNVIRAAFDACDVCFPEKKGYDQEGEYMVCNNCGRKFHSTRINVVEGGCNPAPLQREMDGEHLLIKLADIRTGARFFR